MRRYWFRILVIQAVLGLFVSWLPVFAEDANEATPPKESLVTRLGFTPDARVLIINGDDFGMNHATNEGTIKALKSGGITSTTVMVPCPWFLEAAEFARKNSRANVGVHTTLTSEWGKYKWGPVLGWKAVPGLCDPQGYFWDDVPLVYLSANLEEVEKEVRAQVDKALQAGIDVTHIDSHMGTMQYMPAYHELYIRVAKDYNLPCRMAGHDLMDRFGGGYLIEMADRMGVLHPDVLYMDDPPSIEATESFWKERISQLQPGKVSEIYIHCAVESPEIRATTGSAARRIADTDFFSNPETRKWILGQGVELISYRELRYLQREGKPMPRTPIEPWD